jgi:hypothetical protein
VTHNEQGVLTTAMQGRGMQPALALL